MALPALSVEGPEFAQRVKEADALTRKLEENQWDFDIAPQLFGRTAACDVAAKEIAIIHDGKMQTRIGRLVMTGVGSQFNLLGPESPLALLKNSNSSLLDTINSQVGSSGLYDFDEFHKLRPPQRVEFHNFNTFYQPRDLVFWSALYDCGLFPSGFEHMVRHMAAGRAIHNVLFDPAIGALDMRSPVTMQAACLMLQFPTPEIEWMDKPLFGGVVRETMHIVNLLTLEQTKASHPYLPLVGEGKVEYCEQRYYLRRFVGISPKTALRGPGIPPEGQ